MNNKKVDIKFSAYGTFLE